MAFLPLANHISRMVELVLIYITKRNYINRRYLY